MINFSKRPQGGFGNRLFHYNFALQIAKKFELQVCTEIGNDEKYIKLLSKEPSNLSWKGSSHYKWSDFKSLSKQDTLMMLVDSIKAQKKIVLKGPFLGDSFFYFADYSPKSLILPQYLESSNLNSESLDCVIHIRGGDFHSWNPLAIQSIDYYINSINSVFDDNQNITFHVVTDDPDMLLVKSIKSYLVEHFQYKESLINDFRNDLVKLSSCHYLISSPSTFAIWGAILSTVDVKVIHSKKWVDYCINKEETFWMKVNEGGNKYYKVWDIIDG